MVEREHRLVKKYEELKCGNCPARERSCFASLPTKEEKEIAELKKHFSFKKNDFLPLASGFYCVRDGYLSVGANLSDGPNTVRICGPGDLIGYGTWDASLNGAHTLKAIKEGSVCFFEKNDFLRLQSRSPNIAIRINQMLCKIIAQKDARISSLQNHSVRNRVASLLMSLNKKFGVRSEYGSKIDIPIDRGTMAQLAGTVVETLSRVLSDFEEDKLIFRKGRGIYILSESKLKQVSRD